MIQSKDHATNIKEPKCLDELKLKNCVDIRVRRGILCNIFGVAAAGLSHPLWFIGRGSTRFIVHIEDVALYSRSLQLRGMKRWFGVLLLYRKDVFKIMKDKFKSTCPAFIFHKEGWIFPKTLLEMGIPVYTISTVIKYSCL
jgi:hypothetical protein